MFAVFFAALGFAGLRSSTGPWSLAISEATLFLLLFAIPAVFSSHGRLRAFWVGFCVFGWGHYIIGATPWFGDIYGSTLRELFEAAGSLAFPGEIASDEFSNLGPKVRNFIRISRCITVLGSAFLGGLITGRITADLACEDAEISSRRDRSEVEPESNRPAKR